MFLSFSFLFLLKFLCTALHLLTCNGIHNNFAVMPIEAWNRSKRYVCCTFRYFGASSYYVFKVNIEWHWSYFWGTFLSSFLHMFKWYKNYLTWEGYVFVSETDIEIQFFTGEGTVWWVIAKKASSCKRLMINCSYLKAQWVAFLFQVAVGQLTVKEW